MLVLGHLPSAGHFLGTTFSVQALVIRNAVKRTVWNSLFTDLTLVKQNFCTIAALCTTSHNNNRKQRKTWDKKFQGN